MARTLTPEQAERRAKKQARREKQRQANTGRAAKMRDARLASNLPTTRGLDEKQTLFIGCSDWFYWDWRGRFYPGDLPTSRWFAHYAKHFNTVELNAPFLFLADRRHRKNLAAAGGTQEVHLHGEGLRADHPRQTLRGI